MTRVVRQFLESYAQPEAKLAASVEGSYEHVLVVPALDEPAAAITRLGRTGGALTIVVVNASDGRSAGEHESNTALLHDLGVRGQPWLLTESHGAALLVVDRASAGRRLPQGQGVGLARRIGCDIALALISRHTIASRWIHSTDADVDLPHNYYTAAASDRSAHGLCYPFWHECDLDTETGRALAHYEVWLRYYVAMLRAAGSRYGVHCLGSTLAIDATSYARDRGVPRRQAGEDF